MYYNICLACHRVDTLSLTVYRSDKNLALSRTNKHMLMIPFDKNRHDLTFSIALHTEHIFYTPIFFLCQFLRLNTDFKLIFVVGQWYFIETVTLWWFVYTSQKGWLLYNFAINTDNKSNLKQNLATWLAMLPMTHLLTFFSEYSQLFAYYTHLIVPPHYNRWYCEARILQNMYICLISISIPVHLFFKVQTRLLYLLF